MTNFFEIFNPGAKHAREQKDFENTLVVDYKKSGPGQKPLDLESGKVEIWVKKRTPQPPLED